MNHNRRTLLNATLPALFQPPPDPTEHLNIISGGIISLVTPPPDPMLDIRQRLFPSQMNIYQGRDVFTLFVENRYQFNSITGETPETLIQLLNFLDLNTRFEHKLSNINRVLLFVIWLRRYPSYNMLAATFNISVTTIHCELNTLLHASEPKLKTYIRWPMDNQWQQMRGN